MNTPNEARSSPELYPHFPADAAALDDSSHCPACGGSRATLAWRTNSEAAAQHFVLREADPDRHGALRRHIETLWQGTTCELMTCESCGFGFAWPYVGGDALFYDLAYANPGYPVRRWEFDRTLRALRRLPTAGSRALEVGSGFGAFLDAVVSRKLFARDALIAVEYNREARRLLTKKGYRAVGIDIRDKMFPDDVGHFDFVFMFQVLEHMDRIDATFTRLGDLTTAQGHVFIAVPNATRIAFNEQNGTLLDMPPNHIGRWTPTAFNRIAARHGFSIVEAERENCGLMDFAVQDTVSRYLRRAQEPESLANRVRRRRRSGGRRIAELAIIAALGPSRLPAWGAALLRRRELGESFWVCLRKG
jgi:hypothetical protein